MNSMEQLKTSYAQYRRGFANGTKVVPEEKNPMGILTRKTKPVTMENKEKSPMDEGMEIFSMLANKRKEINNAKS